MPPDGDESINNKNINYPQSVPDKLPTQNTEPGNTFGTICALLIKQRTLGFSFAIYIFKLHRMITLNLKYTQVK
jgi:hypothetical protein